MRALGVRFLHLLAVTSSGCGDDGRGGGDEDAGIAVDTGAPDTGLDAGPPPPSALFGPCTEDSQCPGEGGFCRTPDEGYPNGQCSIACMAPDRTPCDDGITYHHCLSRTDGSGDFCEYRCLNGLDCGRTGYTCVGIGEVAADSGYCIGVCSEGAPCGAGADCNVWSGECVPTGTVPTEGGRNGDPCVSNAACLSGLCIRQRGSAPRFTGGMCFGNCILPVGYNTSTIFAGDALPQGGCPAGNVCFIDIFRGVTFTEGDLGLCLPECHSDADCRASEGYECVQALSGESWSNGICVSTGTFR